MEKHELLDNIADYLLEQTNIHTTGRCPQKGFFTIPQIPKTFSGTLPDILAYLFQRDYMNPDYYGGSGDDYHGSSGTWGWGLDIIPVDVLKVGAIHGRTKELREDNKNYLGVEVEEIPEIDFVKEFKSKQGFINYVKNKWEPQGSKLCGCGKGSYLDGLEWRASKLYGDETYNCFE